MEVRFVDTTFRDGSQSLWASGMRTGMIEAVAQDMERAGFDVIEVPINAIYFKKFVRDLKEDPWDMARMVAREMPRTVKSCMAGAVISPFEAPPPRSIIELFYTRLAEIGALNRVQLVSNTFGQIQGSFPWIIPLFKKLGFKIALALSYTISPRHTDEYYGNKTLEILPFKPDVIYLKDQGGLLTVDRLRTLLPTIVRNAAIIPVELHSHCTTGLAEVVYLEALKLGVNVLHTAVPPLANGSGQPSIFSISKNVRLLGFSTTVDEKILRAVEERLTAIARQENLPVGAPLEYDYGQYIHQVPGGVISNLRYQLKGLGLQDRIDEILEEAVKVRRDLGYPIMITPHSQFVVTQAAINVSTGERYKLVIDELILFAQGIYGEDSGYPWMDQNLRDKLLSMPRAKELAQLQKTEMSLNDIRKKLGAFGITDEDLLLRLIMKGDQEIQSMREAGPSKKYHGAPLLTLIQELAKQKRVRYVHVEKDADSLVLQNRSSPAKRYAANRGARRPSVSSQLEALSDDEIHKIALLIEALEKSTFDFLQLQVGNIKLTIGTGSPALGQELTNRAVMPTGPGGQPAPAEQVSTSENGGAVSPERSDDALDDGKVTIQAPIMGVFYDKPHPGAVPFVKVGSLIEENTTVCLIEIMKLFQSVRGGVSGVITEICVKDKEMVENGQILFRVEPLKPALSEEPNS
jgi:oxaloacetate decarboxylase (Na+ extruding) subunit alpha